MGTQGDGGGDAAAGVGDAKKDDIYENRPRHKKIVRVVTVMAYMVSVSFVAIVLSAYYVFLWQPPNPRLMHRSHLRADPQVEYLVHGPPIGSADDVPQDGVDDLDRVIVLGEKISVGPEGEKSTGRSESLKVSGVDPRSKEENKIGDDRRTRAWNPIVRALLATTERPGVGTLPDSTGVYESPDATMKSSLISETSNSAIGGSTTRGPSSRSMTVIHGRDEFHGSVNYSGSIVEKGDESDEESVNRSTTIGFDDSSESTGADFGRGFGESVRLRANESIENSGNFTPEVQPIPIGTVETSGESAPVEVQPETLGTNANLGPNSGEPMRKWAKESLENSGNFTPEVQPIPIGTVETSGESAPVEVQPETLGTNAHFGPNSGEPMRKWAKESLENSGNFTPEVQPIPIGTVETSGESAPVKDQPETLETNANLGPNFGEPMRKWAKESLENSGNFTPEVQTIPIGTVETSGESAPVEAQPETLGTTAAFERQRGSDWEPLGFTVGPTKPGLPVTRVEAKSPVNDTESVGKFSSPLEANEDVSIAMIAGPAGDAELASEQSASAVPAVVQPEPDYVDK